MIRIRHEGRSPVFEYAGVKKRDAAAAIAQHLSMFGFEMLRDPMQKNAVLNGSVGFLTPTKTPPITAEWVNPDGSVEPLPVPAN